MTPDNQEKAIETFSILAGSLACSARCPFCVSKMTPPNGIKLQEPEVNWEAFGQACRYAKENDVRTAMITGKGEPTLFPGQITKYMEALERHGFPSVELQTNGIPMADNKDGFEPHLRRWHECGLGTVAVSVVHYEPERNREIYLPYRKHYIDLPGLVNYLHEKDRRFAVRLACIMLKSFIDGPEELEKLMEFSRRYGAEQLTVRPVNKPEESGDAGVEKYVADQMLTDSQISGIRHYLDTRGKVARTFPYGGAVYDVNGQNVCLTNSLTHDRSRGSMRQLIFFPDGHVSEEWTKPRVRLYERSAE